MPNDYNKRVTRSIFDNYASGGSKSENKSRLESLNIFREGLSHYSIKKHQIIELGGACKWDKRAVLDTIKKKQALGHAYGANYSSGGRGYGYMRP